MKLELEERGNIHTETVWFEIIDSQAPPGDESNTVATMVGLSEEDYQRGCLFTAAPELLIACKKQDRLIEKLLTLYCPRAADAHIPSSIVNNVRTFARKAIAKARHE